VEEVVATLPLGKEQSDWGSTNEHQHYDGIPDRPSMASLRRWENTKVMGLINPSSSQGTEALFLTLESLGFRRWRSIGIRKVKPEDFGSIAP